MHTNSDIAYHICMYVICKIHITIKLHATLYVSSIHNLHNTYIIPCIQEMKTCFSQNIGQMVKPSKHVGLVCQSGVVCSSCPPSRKLISACWIQFSTSAFPCVAKILTHPRGRLVPLEEKTPLGLVDNLCKLPSNVNELTQFLNHVATSISGNIPQQQSKWNNPKIINCHTSKSRP